MKKDKFVELAKFSNGTLNPQAQACWRQQPDINMCYQEAIDKINHPVPFQNTIQIANHKALITTKGNIEITSGTTTCRAKLDVLVIIRGICGPNNSGGTGICIPEYETQLQLSMPSNSGKWQVDTKMIGHNPNGKVTGDFNILISNATYTKKIEWPMNSKEYSFTFSNLSPGIFDIILKFPLMERGCLGSYPGTVAESQFSMSMIFDVYLI